jgi:hypothetical protein
MATNGNGRNGSNGRHEQRNAMLFWTAAAVSFSLVSWFTLAFFKKVLGMNDVSLGIMSIGLAIIASYAGHNKFLKVRCGDNGENCKNRPGEWIFFFIVVWTLLMWSLYQTKALEYWKGIELVIPEQFYEFIGGIVAIFGGTRIWDVFTSTKNQNTTPPGITSSKQDPGAPA